MTRFPHNLEYDAVCDHRCIVESISGAVCYCADCGSELTLPTFDLDQVPEGGEYDENE